MSSLTESKGILLRGSIRLKNKRQQKAYDEENLLREMFRPKINISINDNSKNKAIMLKDYDYLAQNKQNYVTFDPNKEVSKANYDLEDLKNIKEMLEFESSIRNFKEKKDKFENQMENKYENHQSQTTVHTLNQKRLANSKSTKALHENTGSDCFMSSLALSNENMVVKGSVEKSSNICKAENMKHQSLNNTPLLRKGSKISQPSAQRKSTNLNKNKHKNAWADYFEKEGIKIGDMLPEFQQPNFE